MSKTLKEIRWAARRGMLELDLILIPFIEEHYESMSPADQACLDTLLQEPDPLLFAWLMGHEAAVAPYVALVKRIQSA